MTRLHRYDTIGPDEELHIELPHHIGVVRIRTGDRHVRTGHPRIAVEIVSDTVDEPAADGLFYEPSYDSMQETVYLTGRPPHTDTEKEG